MPSSIDKYAAFQTSLAWKRLNDVFAGAKFQKAPARGRALFRVDEPASAAEHGGRAVHCVQAQSAELAREKCEREPAQDVCVLRRPHARGYGFALTRERRWAPAALSYPGSPSIATAIHSMATSMPGPTVA